MVMHGARTCTAVAAVDLRTLGPLDLGPGGSESAVRRVREWESGEVWTNREAWEVADG